MTDIGTFPTITDPAPYPGTTITCVTTGTIDILPGMVVCLNATGVSLSVEACVAGSGSMPIGIALTAADVSAAEYCTVMINGVGVVANADDTATFDAGDYVIFNANAVGGTVSVATITSTATALAVLVPGIVGIMLEDVAASGTGKCLLTPGNTLTRANSS